MRKEKKKICGPWVYRDQNMFLMRPGRNLPLAAVIRTADGETKYTVTISSLADPGHTDYCATPEAGKKLIEEVMTAIGWLILTQKELNLL